MAIMKRISQAVCKLRLMNSTALKRRIGYIAIQYDTKCLTYALSGLVYSTATSRNITKNQF